MTIIAALDGSTLEHDLVMRVINSPDFNRDNIDTVILHRQTVEEEPELVDQLHKKGINPFLKIDIGTCENGSMKTIDMFDASLTVKTYDMVGTKMRSIVNNLIDIGMIVKQQLTYATLINRMGIIPIVEPEVPINIAHKSTIEETLHKVLVASLEDFNGKVILKLTIPDQDGLYDDLLEIPQVERIVALSGGYSLAQATERLAHNKNMGASFSRALLQDLSLDMDEGEFNKLLLNNISAIKKSVDEKVE